jgi:hypothetical protein
VQHALPVWPEELHAQDLLPRPRGEQAWSPREPHAGDLIDPYVYRPARRVVAEFEVPPVLVSWSAEYRCCHVGEVREVTVDAEGEDLLQRGPRQLCDQAFAG